MLNNKFHSFALLEYHLVCVREGFIAISYITITIGAIPGYIWVSIFYCNFRFFYCWYSSFLSRYGQSSIQLVCDITNFMIKLFFKILFIYSIWIYLQMVLNINFDIASSDFTLNQLYKIDNVICYFIFFLFHSKLILLCCML